MFDVDQLDWNEAPFRGVARLWPGRANVSSAFRPIVATTGAPTFWEPDNLPQMEIPVDGGAPITVPGVLDGPSGLVTFVLSGPQSDAAITAQIMFWVEAGQRLGVVEVVAQ